MLVACGFWQPDAKPLPEQPLITSTTIRVAAVLVDDGEQPFLTPWVVLSPAAPPQYATRRLAVTLAPELMTRLPWRSEAGTSYVPVVGTLSRDAEGRITLDDVDAVLREQTVANHDTQRLVRVIGTLQPRDGTLVLVDRNEKTAFLPFADPLVPTSPLLRHLQAATRLGDELLVEGVVSHERMIPLVFAPVFDVRP